MVWCARLCPLRRPQVTKAWYEQVRQQAAIRIATLVKQQEAAMDTLKAKNEKLLGALQARYQRDLANLDRLHEGQLRRARAISKSQNPTEVSAPPAQEVAKKKVARRPRSAARSAAAPTVAPAEGQPPQAVPSFNVQQWQQRARPKSATARLQARPPTEREAEKADWEHTMTYLVQLADSDLDLDLLYQQDAAP